MEQGLNEQATNADHRMLTAAEAAARLGVKRATLYAYVSRGLLSRQVALDGRTSLFDADEIAAFRSSRKSAAQGELSTVLSSGITRVRDDGLLYRGRDVAELLAAGLAYENVVDTLWGSTAPWPESAAIVDACIAAQQHLPSSTPRIDRLRIITAATSALDPLRYDLSPAATHAAGRTLLRAMVMSLPVTSAATIDESGGLADQLWVRLSPRRGSRAERAALNAALVALIDHGLASSTFAVRIAASVRADPYSAVSAGLGVGGGPFHGAASAAVHDLLVAAESGDPAAAVGDARKRLGHMPGFGHTVYKEQDPRFGALMTRVLEAWPDHPRTATVHTVRDVISERSDRLVNVDFALGSLSFLGGMDADAGETIFMIARTAGWIAHAGEEYLEKPLRFRPQARYTGPTAPSTH